MTPLVWPLPRLDDGRLPVITQAFRSPRHLGVDVMYPWREGDPTTPPRTAQRRRDGHPVYCVPVGVPVLAVADGHVLYARRAANGWRTRVRTLADVDVLDLHMVELYVAAGDRVRQGQRLGLCGGDPTDAPHHLVHDHHEHRRPARAGEPHDGYGCVAIDPEVALATAVVVVADE